MSKTSSETFDLETYIMRHIQDSQEWHLPFLPPITLPGWLSLHTLMLFICAGFLISVFCFIYDKRAKIPAGITNMLEAFVVFIRDQIAITSLGEEDGRRMTPFFCTMFFFILGLNLIGMIPLFATATGNISVTGGLAFITFCVMTLGAIMKNGLKGFLKALVPSGVPAPFLLIIVPIEALGLGIKSFALMIRLFANMMAGHIVILSILGMIVTIGYVAALPAVILALFISLLEVLVAFLQAYIFTLLSAIFIGLIYHPDH
jgi:F-type H+-transporting ATPase subunit a